MQKDWRKKVSNETVPAFYNMITEKNTHNSVSVKKATEFYGEFRKLCGGVGLEIYTTLNETYAALGERTIRSLWCFFLPLEEKFWIQVNSQNVAIR